MSAQALNGLNLILLDFTIHGKLSIIRCNTLLTLFRAGCLTFHVWENSILFYKNVFVYFHIIYEFYEYLICIYFDNNSSDIKLNLSKQGFLYSNKIKIH